MTTLNIDYWVDFTLIY